MDVVTAFQVEEEIYMEQPEGFEIDGKNMVCRLLRSLYGLKQSAQVWNCMLWDHLLANGYKQLYSDHGLYYNGMILIAVYIDDLAIAGPRDLEAINEAKKMLELAFNMKDLGECEHLLSMSIIQGPDGTISIGQQGYIEAMLREFGLKNCNPAPMLMEPGQKLVPVMSDDPRCNQEKYQ